jgi:hypothetical protein
MRTELFIKIPKNIPSPIQNGNFAQGMANWSGGTFSTLSNGAIYMNGNAVNGEIIQNGIVHSLGSYKIKVTVTPPLNGGALTGFVRVGIGNVTQNLSTVGTHTVYLTPTTLNWSYIMIAPSGLTIGGALFNGGVTNISIEGVDGDYQQIDLYDDIKIPLNYNIADITDITKKNASYSKTVTIPGTSRNNKLFKNIFNISTTGAFTMNKPINCYVLQDSYRTFEGSFELIKCNIDHNREISYEGFVYSQTANLFVHMGNKLLTGNPFSTDDIDFSEYTQIITKTNIENSFFSSTIGQGLLWVPIDKYNKYGTNSPTFKTDQMSPSVYIKEIFDKIFAKAGFTYESDFLNSDFFKRLIYPFTDTYLRVPEDQRLAKSFSGTMGPEIRTQIYPNESTYPPYYEMNQSDGGYWNVIHNGSLEPWEPDYGDPNWGQFIAKEAGWYNIKLNYKYRVRFYEPDYAMFSSWYVKTRQSGFAANLWFILKRASSGTEIVLAQKSHGYSLPEKVHMTYSYSTNPLAEDTISYTNRIFLNQGDRIMLRQRVLLPFCWSNGSGAWMFEEWNTGHKLDLILELRPVDGENNFLKIEADNIVTEGMLLNPTYILHSGIKQADFINSIIKMFNLYLEPISDTSFRIEPRDGYYNISGTVRDWTDKVSIDNTISIERPSDLIEYILNFKYDHDGDHFSDVYKRSNQFEYGEYYQKNIQNIDDNKNLNIKLIFCPAPHGPVVPGSRIEIPKIFKFKDDSTINETFSFKPRILYWGGIKQTFSSHSFRLENLTGTNISVYSGMWPYCGHLDDVYGNEENDLMFWSNNWYWCDVGYPPGWVTYRNLYNVYYKNMIEEYLDNDSKLVTMKIKLFPKDMENLRFFDTIFIDGIYYRINKITNYLPGELATVELLKIKAQKLTFKSTKPIIIVKPTDVLVTNILEKVNDYVHVIDGMQNATVVPNTVVAVDVVDSESHVIDTNPEVYDRTYLQPRTNNVVFVDVVNNADPVDLDNPVTIREMKDGPNINRSQDNQFTTL